MLPVFALSVAVSIVWSDEAAGCLQELFVAVERAGAYGKTVFIFVYASVCVIGVVPAPFMALASGALAFIGGRLRGDPRRRSVHSVNCDNLVRAFAKNLSRCPGHH